MCGLHRPRLQRVHKFFYWYAFFERNEKYANLVLEEEKKYNPRLAEHITIEKFKEIMASLNLPPPKHIATALPANLEAGKNS